MLCVKNTNREDCSGYVKAAKQLVYNIKKRLDGNESSLSNNSNSNHDGLEQMAVDVETQRSRDGLKVLMGSALANTNAHIVSAPMATWLVRNDSRFGFTNEFQYVSIKIFAQGNFNDLVLTSNYKGSVLVKSQVANYIFGPQELHDMCVYDFFSKYVTTMSKKVSIKIN